MVGGRASARVGVTVSPPSQPATESVALARSPPSNRIAVRQQPCLRLRMPPLGNDNEQSSAVGWEREWTQCVTTAPQPSVSQLTAPRSSITAAVMSATARRRLSSRCSKVERRRINGAAITHSDSTTTGTSTTTSSRSWMDEPLMQRRSERDSSPNRSSSGHRSNNLLWWTMRRMKRSLMMPNSCDSRCLHTSTARTRCPSCSRSRCSSQTHLRPRLLSVNSRDSSSHNSSGIRLFMPCSANTRRSSLYR